MTRPKVNWIDLPAGVRLAIMPRPRAGDWLDDEVGGWRAEGIGVIVSLLEAGEVKELGLHQEAALCHDLDMEFIAFPVPDGGVPASTRETMALAEAIVARLDEGKAVAVHCGAGIGRSSLIAACVLALLGLAPGMAFDRIGQARGVKVPDTEEQRDWVDMFRETTTKRRHPSGLKRDLDRYFWITARSICLPSKATTMSNGSKAISPPTRKTKSGVSESTT